MPCLSNRLGSFTLASGLLVSSKKCSILAATSATAGPGPLQEFYRVLLAKGIRPDMARLTLARKIAAITLTIWKKGVDFDAHQLHRQVA